VPLTSSELEPLLRLALVQGVGPHRLARLVRGFGSADGAVGAFDRQLREVAGIGPELSARIRSAGGTAARAVTRHSLDRLARLEAVALTPDDPLYPPAFHTVADPPYLLFAAGRLDLLELPALAVVGTRSPTNYGRSAALSLSRDLALAGFAIVSGAARGIDTAAHRGALEASGATIAVLGHGIDQVYPPENGKLFTRIRREGLLLTEYPPGETPRAGNFPRRNRLITALSEAVLVVEMGHRSGAQHTVGFALEQGKEVLAVPGPITSLASAGTNQLIKDGARMVTSAEDVFEELKGVGTMPSVPAERGTPPEPRAGVAADRSPALNLLTEVEHQLLAALDGGDLHVDEVVTRSALPADSALSGLLELELRGLVRACPGMRYARV
jgi:DNA processing protein